MGNFLTFMKEQYQKWNYRRKRNSYYWQQNEISRFSRIVNLLLAEMVLFAGGYLWFVYRTKIPTLAFILNAVVNGLLITAFLLWDRKSFQKKKARARRKAARDFLANQLLQLDQEEFKWQVMRLLLKLEQIGDITSKADYLETTYSGKPMAVGYYNASIGEEVSPQQLAAFLNKVKKQGYSEVLYATSGKYAKQCSALTEKKSIPNVHLLDLEDLLDLMEKSGMYPDDRVIDALIDKEICNRKRKLLIFKKEILTPKRIRTYLGYSLFFIVLSALFRTLSLYYTLASVAFLMLALLSYIRGLQNPAESAAGKSFVETLTPKSD